MTYKNPYAGDFHKNRHQETSYSADKILTILLNDGFQINSAVDVGCGVGTFLSFLKQKGVQDIMGFDGDWVDRNLLVIPYDKFSPIDLKNIPKIDRTYDIAICLEVAEHLPPENALHLIKKLCELSNLVLFSAAVPRQGGVAHLNEAWQSYWAKLFARQNYYPVDIIRPKIWDDQAIPFWYRQNILVYLKKEMNANQYPTTFPLDIIHPELFLMRTQNPDDAVTNCGLFKKLYLHAKKDGLLTTAFLSIKHVYLRIKPLTFIVNKINKLFLHFDLKKRLLDQKSKIKDGLKITEIRAQTLQFIEQMRIKNSPYGQYKYAPCQKSSVLYASIYAILTRHLYNDLQEITPQQKEEWVKYIKSFQSEDGWFRDPAIECELANSIDWWGWKHLTYHAIMALTCFEALPDKQFLFLEPFKDANYIESWFKKLYITEYPSEKTNVHLPMYIVTLLQYARDYQNTAWANTAIQKIIGLLNEKINPKTGCWCTGNGQKEMLSEGVKITYHLWMPYFYDKLPIPYPTQAIDSVLSTQNALGGFDQTLNSSACDDIDGIDPLCRMKNITDYRKSEVDNSLLLTIPWVLANMNSDGGFVFKRGQDFKYGHDKMYSRANESNMFATWFRTLSLADIGKTLPNSWLGRFEWNFGVFPGLQFWHSEKKIN